MYGFCDLNRVTTLRVVSVVESEVHSCLISTEEMTLPNLNKYAINQHQKFEIRKWWQFYPV